MKLPNKCAGCDKTIILSMTPILWEKGLRRVRLLLISGATCSVTLCGECAKVPPELLPRIWREYTEAMAATVNPAHQTDARTATLLFQQDVPLAKLYCEPWPLVEA